MDIWFEILCWSRTSNNASTSTSQRFVELQVFCFNSMDYNGDLRWKELRESRSKNSTTSPNQNSTLNSNRTTGFNWESFLKKIDNYPKFRHLSMGQTWFRHPLEIDRDICISLKCTNFKITNTKQLKQPTNQIDCTCNHWPLFLFSVAVVAVWCI